MDRAKKDKIAERLGAHWHSLHKILKNLTVAGEEDAAALVRKACALIDQAVDVLIDEDDPDDLGSARLIRDGAIEKIGQLTEAAIVEYLDDLNAERRDY